MPRFEPAPFGNRPRNVYICFLKSFFFSKCGLILEKCKKMVTNTLQNKKWFSVYLHSGWRKQRGIGNVMLRLFSVPIKTFLFPTFRLSSWGVCKMTELNAALGNEPEQGNYRNRTHSYYTYNHRLLPLPHDARKANEMFITNKHFLVFMHFTKTESFWFVVCFCYFVS